MHITEIKLWILISIFFINTYPTYSQTEITISGRAVDNQGNPIENAQVFIESNKSNDLTGSLKTNKSGKFEVPIQPSPKKKYTLYIIEPIPESYHILLRPPFDTYLNIETNLYHGTTITNLKGTKTELGDITSFSYGKAHIQFIDEKGQPFFSKNNEEINLLISIKNRHNQYISSTPFPLKSTPTAQYQNESTINLAAPEGIWKIEFLLSKDNNLLIPPIHKDIHFKKLEPTHYIVTIN